MAAAAAGADGKIHSQNLPQVLVLRKPSTFAVYGEEAFTSNKFRYLKAYESTLPLPQFLATHGESVKAIFSSAGAPVTADILRMLPEVKLVVATSTGLDHIDVAECRRRGVAVANAGGVFSEDVADMAVGLLIDVMRKISAADRFVRRGLWPSKGEYPLGSKVIIIFISVHSYMYFLDLGILNFLLVRSKVFLCIRNSLDFDHFLVS